MARIHPEEGGLLPLDVSWQAGPLEMYAGALVCLERAASAPRGT